MRVARVRALLTCPVYRGRRVYRGVAYPAELPEVVPAETVARVDELLAQNDLRPQRTGGQHNSKAVFAGLLKCPTCASWLTVQIEGYRRSDRAPYYCYRCPRAYAPPKTCDWRRCVPSLTFEQELVPGLLAHLSNIALPDPVKQERQTQRRDRARGRLEAERERIIALHVRGRIGEAEADKLLDRVDSQLEALAEDAPPALPAISPAEVREATKQMRRLWPHMTPPQKRGLLQTLIVHITPTEPWADSDVDWRV